MRACVCDGVICLGEVLVPRLGWTSLCVFTQPHYLSVFYPDSDGVSRLLRYDVSFLLLLQRCF